MTGGEHLWASGSQGPGRRSRGLVNFLFLFKAHILDEGGVHPFLLPLLLLHPLYLLLLLPLHYLNLHGWGGGPLEFPLCQSGQRDG